MRKNRKQKSESVTRIYTNNSSIEKNKDSEKSEKENVRSPVKNKIKKSIKALKSTLLKKMIALVVFLIVFRVIAVFLPNESEVNPSDKLTINVDTSDSLKTTFQIPKVHIYGLIPNKKKETALSFFKAAERLFAEKEIRHQNIYSAIQKWQKGIDIIGRYEPRPSEFDTAVVNIKIAIDELDNKFRYLQKLAIIAKNQKDIENANEILNIILEMIPDRDDLKYQWAKDFQIRLKS